MPRPSPLALALVAGLAPAALAGDAGVSFLHLYPEAAPAASGPWHLEQVPVELASGRRVALRAGWLAPSPGAPPRGDLVYLQGFSDSMRNHDPLLRGAAALGYRVVAFDYPGQGGSAGTMNWTRVPEIPAMAEAVLAHFGGATSGPRTWLGWSTGALATWLAASEGRVDRAVLLAPGIHIHPIVGEWGRVTPETLTGHAAAGLPDPHLDPPSPTAPALLPGFALSILKSSLVAQTREIPPGVEGLVLLSGPEDRYVRGEATRATLARKAPHFEVRVFEEGLHELDNEVEPTGSQVRAAALAFLAR